jgi:hypothetical protein
MYDLKDSSFIVNLVFTLHYTLFFVPLTDNAAINKLAIYMYRAKIKKCSYPLSRRATAFTTCSLFTGIFHSYQICGEDITVWCVTDKAEGGSRWLPSGQHGL